MTSRKTLATFIASLGVTAAVQSAAAHDVVDSRTFTSSPEQVWMAWSDPALIKQWWGPNGFTATKVDVNFDVGASTIVCMEAEGAPLMCNTWTYTAIEPAKELRFESRFAAEDGIAVPAAEAGLPLGVPDVVPHRVTFEPTDSGGTVVTVHESGYTTAEAADLSKQGLVQVLDKMQALVP